MWFCLQLLIGFLIRAGRIGQIKPASLIKRAGNRPLYQWRSGNKLHFKAVGNSEGLVWKLKLSCMRGKSAGETKHPATAKEKPFHTSRRLSKQGWGNSELFSSAQNSS